MDSSQFREAAHSAVDEIAQYYDTLAERPVLPDVAPGYLRPLLPSGPPEDGEPWSAIQADIDRVIMPGLTHWQSPKFMAFFPCNSSFPGMLGEMYSGAFNAAAFNWICSPAITELETVVMDWIAKSLALPDCFQSAGEGGGIIQGTASEVIVTAVVAARERLVRRRLGDMPEGEERIDKAADLRGKMVAMGSEHAHSSTQKAAIIAGTRFRKVSAPRSEKFSVTGKELRKTIVELKAKGLEPYYFTVTIGSTGTCAVDDLKGVAEVARDYPDVWIHVDAAYAGSALVCPEYQHLCSSIEHFDSFNVNLHKWLLVNFDCSAFFVKRRMDLIDTYSLTPSYLRNQYRESGLVTDYHEWQIPLGRRFRSLKVWFVLRTYGINRLRNFIRGHIKQGEYFNGLLDTRKDIFNVITPAAFALTTFQINPPRPDAPPSAYTADFTNDAEAQYREETNRLTKEVYEKVNASKEFFLTSTVVCGLYVIRVVCASERSEEKYMKQCFELLVKTAEEVLKGEN